MHASNLAIQVERRSVPPPSRRIAFAEDDSELRGLVASILTSDGFVVSEATHGQEMLELLKLPQILPPHLIITDVKMPGPSGLRVLAHARRHFPATPVIVITAFGTPELHAEARQLGAAAVLDKPFSIATLRELVRECLAKS